MIWSKQELENLAIGGAEPTRERVLKHLSAPENADIFTAENFSYLWGALGVGGVKGTDAAARRKIWQALGDNGVLDAFDKGILGDFNREMAANFKDSRLRAWKGLDNFQTGVKFQKTILEKLARGDEELAAAAAPLLFDYRQMAEQLDKHELDAKLKTYLERLRGLSAACGISGDAVRAVYEKTMILRKLCDVAAYTSRKLTEAEKDYLFRYLREAVIDGFAPKDIGLDDMVLARLMADSVPEGVSELEKAPLLSRNAEIEEFAAGLEEEQGFFEETAARYIRLDPGKTRELTQRCLKLIAAGKRPKGVIFALALLEMRQVKSAVQILLELAKRGQATEMAGFLHRLLPKAKGAETLIADIVRTNLQNLSGAAEYKRDYAARLALLAVRDFAEAGLTQQGAELLAYLAAAYRPWFMGEGQKPYMALGNMLIAADKNVAGLLAEQARKIGLAAYEAEGATFLGTAADNPLTAARRRLEKSVQGAITLDISAATKKMAGLEAATYGVYRNLKGVFQRRKGAAAGKAAEAAGVEAVRAADEAAAVSVAEAAGVEVVRAADEAVMTGVAGHEGRAASAADEAVADEAAVMEGNAERAMASGADEAEAAGVEAVRAADETGSAAEHEESGYVPAGDPTVKLPAFEEWHDGETESAMESPAFEVGQAADEAAEEVADVAEQAMIEPAAAGVRIDEVGTVDEVAEVSAAVETAAEIEPAAEDKIGAEEQAITQTAEQAAEDVSVATANVTAGAAGVGTDDIAPAENVGSVAPAAESSPVDVATEGAPVDETAGNVVSGEVSAAVVAAENAGGADNVGTETTADKLPAFEEWNNEEENSSSENQSAEVGDVLKITPQEVDAHFQKIKQIMAAAAHKAELIKEKAKKTGLAQSPAVQRIKTWIERKFKK